MKARHQDHKNKGKNIKIIIIKIIITQMYHTIIYGIVYLKHEINTTEIRHKPVMTKWRVIIIYVASVHQGWRRN